MLMEFERPPNKVLEKFRKRKIPYGMGMYSQSPELYELVGWAGFDFVVIDMEHCRVNPERLTELIRICDMAGLTPFVRVPLNDELSIRYATEAGARGIMVPHISSAEDVRKAQSYLRFPPEGAAATCPCVRATKYMRRNWEAYMRESNENTSLIVLIEDVNAVESADEILAELKPERDGIGLGLADIALSFHKDPNKKIDFKHPYTKTATETVVPKAKERGLLNMGIAFPTPDKAGFLNAKANGTTAILFHPDMELIGNMLERFVADCYAAEETIP
jgi:2-keto-3-deoxy-L-rhamnonate aldolase RhmA